MIGLTFLLTISRNVREKKLYRLLLVLLLYLINCQQSCMHAGVVDCWVGALQHNSVKVNARLEHISGDVRLVASTSLDFSNPIFGSAASLNRSRNVIGFFVEGLSSNTKYYYTIEVAGKLYASADNIGSFITPSDSSFSYRFTMGSCLKSDSQHPVFNRMLGKNPLFFLQTGDFHYDNPNSAYSLNTHRRPYERLMTNNTYRKFFKQCPLVYVWDDHDYSGENSDSTAPGKINARIAYREYIPHYPFGTEIRGMDAPIYQSFTIGRVHFILTDLRSCRRRPSMMGSIQKQWFKEQCLYAKSRNLMLAWVSTVPYEGTGPDSWAGFDAERRELADFFNNEQIANLFILSGDSHMIAVDDGTHSDFSTNQNSKFKYPIFQAAALNAVGSNKGGNYSGGAFPNPNNSYGQYGLVEINDHGTDSMEIRMSGYRVSQGGDEIKLCTYTFMRNLNNERNNFE